MAGATERERTINLGDRITGGQLASTEDDWLESAATRARSYRLLLESVK